MSDQPTLQFPPVPGEPAPAAAHRHPAVRAALLAALTTLVLVLPIALFLLLRGAPEDNTQPGAAPPSATPETTTPSAEPSPSSAAPSRPPDGRISLRVLKNATLDIPRWPADNFQGVQGRVRFRDGQADIPARQVPAGSAPYAEHVVILAATYGDVDRDDAQETVAEIGCLIEGGSKQLVAFDRDRAGRIVTLGPVVSTTGELRDLRTGSARVSRSGTVTVRVGDYQGCCDDRTPVTWQTRGYRWQDGRFEQTSGPTTMPVNPAVTETRIFAGELTLGPVVTDHRYGTVQVTVSHRWGTRPQAVKLVFFPPSGLERAGTGWPPVTEDKTSFTVTIDPPLPGGMTTHRYAFRAPPAMTTGHLDIEAWAVDAGGGLAPLSEAVSFNNTTVAMIRGVD